MKRNGARGGRYNAGIEIFERNNKEFKKLPIL
jgi:hypothetical protein